MRKGFQLTLMVAIALMGMQVSAMAPTMSSIPDVIVGDLEGATGSDEFVFPDALNLSQYASDSDGPNASLTWSFEDDGDGRYTFNGMIGLAPADDPVAPPADKSINTDTLGGEDNPDTNDATVTIRNVSLSPIGGPNVATGDTPGILPGETEIVTLYVSDGATISQTEITVYSDNEGEDRLSSSEDTIYSETFDAGAANWTFKSDFAIGGTVTSSSNTGALCVSVSAAGVNDGQWLSPYDLFELTNNSVYIGRFSLTTGQATVGAVPLVSVLMENASEGIEAAQLFFGENYFLDNFGGANAPQGHPAGRAQHVVLFTPPPVSNAEWQNGAFLPANDDFNDFRVRMRILDVENVGYGAENDSGQVCLNDVSISKVDIGAFTRGAALYDQQDVSASTYHGTQITGTTFTYASGDVTIAPSDGNWEVEVAQIFPGDGVGDLAAGGAAIADDYPVAWTEDTLYELVIGVNAPNATGQSNPPDLIRMGLDVPTQEYIGLSQISPALGGIGTPNTGGGQVYRGFYAPNSVSLSTVENHDALRPRFDVITHDAFGWNGNAGNTNAGGIIVEGMAVYPVTY